MLGKLNKLAIAACLIISFSVMATEQAPKQVLFKNVNIFSVSQNINITPSMQLLQDPAFNTLNDSVTLFGLRFRLTL